MYTCPIQKLTRPKLNIHAQKDKQMLPITLETITRAVALIHFSRNFGQNLVSKMQLLSELRLLFEGGSYYSMTVLIFSNIKILV